jgi:hypothetical protein
MGSGTNNGAFLAFGMEMAFEWGNMAPSSKLLAVHFLVQHSFQSLGPQLGDDFEDISLSLSRMLSKE